MMPDIACPFAIEGMKGVNHTMIRFEFDFLVYKTFSNVTGGETGPYPLFH